MTLDEYTFWLFIAGVLAGTGVTIMASLIPAIPRVYRDYRAYFQARRRRKRSGE